MADTACVLRREPSPLGATARHPRRRGRIGQWRMHPRTERAWAVPSGRGWRRARLPSSVRRHDRARRLSPVRSRHFVRVRMHCTPCARYAYLRGRGSLLIGSNYYALANSHVPTTSQASAENQDRVPHSTPQYYRGRLRYCESRSRYEPCETNRPRRRPYVSTRSASHVESSACKAPMALRFARALDLVVSCCDASWLLHR